jgi:hypothetical protein
MADWKLIAVVVLFTLRGHSKRKHRSLLRSGFFTLRLVDSNLPENLRCASAMMMKGIHSQTAAHGQKNTFSDARRQTCAPRQNLIGSVLVHKTAPYMVGCPEREKARITPVMRLCSRWLVFLSRSLADRRESEGHLFPFLIGGFIFSGLLES